MNIIQIAICFVCAVGIQSNVFSQIQNHAFLESPTKEYSVAINKSDSPSGACALNILHNGKSVAHYEFEGELASAYWSPSGKYVAINNHSGHYGWWVWIISLPDGRLVRKGGFEKASLKYDRYVDSDYFPDLFSLPVIKEKLGAVYSGYDSDHMRLGYLTISYGWENGDVLLCYHRLAFDQLVDLEDSVIQVLAKYKIRPEGTKIVGDGVYVKKMSLTHEPKEVPPEIARVFFE